jgi:hypothetical protein
MDPREFLSYQMSNKCSLDLHLNKRSVEGLGHKYLCLCLLAIIPICVLASCLTSNLPHPSICLSICLPLFPSSIPHLFFICLLTCPPVSLSVCPTIHLKVNPSIYLSVYQSDHLFVYLSVQMHVCVYICSSSYLYIYISIYLRFFSPVCLPDCQIYYLYLSTSYHRTQFSMEINIFMTFYDVL